MPSVFVCVALLIGSLPVFFTAADAKHTCSSIRGSSDVCAEATGSTSLPFSCRATYFSFTAASVFPLARVPFSTASGRCACKQHKWTVKAPLGSWFPACASAKSSLERHKTHSVKEEMRERKTEIRSESSLGVQMIPPLKPPSSSHVRCSTGDVAFKQRAFFFSPGGKVESYRKKQITSENISVQH